MYPNEEKQESTKRGPWLPQVEDTGGESSRKVEILRKRWGQGGRLASIAYVIRRAVDEAYDRERAQKKAPAN